jgi:hypothetical protein
MKTLLKSCLLATIFFVAARAESQVPQLNSYPSASATIFLDFDGQTVIGTTWNYSGPIYCGASGLTSTQITAIFDRVSEDYRPFNVNITTDSTVFLNAPANKRMRVILTVTSAWYGSAGGVACVGSFSWGDDTPCFIFTQLLNLNVKYISEATSHEAGHTLGLYHQSAYDANCAKTSDYNFGQGTGEIGWAPIMGVGYYENFTLWHNGPNPNGCTSYQKDLDVITSATNGFGFRPDDYANDFVTASNISFVNDQFIINGLIEKNDDRDIFQFTVDSTRQFRLDAIPYNVGSANAGSDVDMQIQLVNSSQVVLGTYNPGNALGSVIDTLLAAGTYYLTVDGKGNIYAPEYGSLGSYSLQGKYLTDTPLPLRKLELKGVVIGDKHQLNWVIDADEEIVKQDLEISTDGRSFSTLTESAIDARSFTYKPSSTGTIQYRLNVTFNNGRQYYSNIVSIRQNGSVIKPHLVSNLLYSNTMTVSSPGKYTYTLYDVNGKLIKQGQITNGINNIDIANISAGMHLVYFTDGKQNSVEKLIKR